MNHSAAQGLFLKLLGGASEGEQLQGLQRLLEHVWQSGDAIPSDQVRVDVVVRMGEVASEI